MKRCWVLFVVAAAAAAFSPLIANYTFAQVPAAQPTYGYSTRGVALTLTTQAAGTVNGSDQYNFGRGLVCVANVTAISGTSPTLTVTVQGKDSTGGLYYALLSSTALSTTGQNVLTVYPGVAVTANVSASVPVPWIYRISATIAGTSPSVTAQVDCDSIP